MLARSFCVKIPGMDAGEVGGYLDSWVIHLTAEHKSLNTIKAYTAGVTAYLRWCEKSGQEPQFRRDQVAGFMADLLKNGAEAATVLNRQRGVRMFSKWLAAEGHAEADDLAVDEAAEDRPEGPRRAHHRADPGAAGHAAATREFHDVRDAAIIRLMVEIHGPRRRAAVHAHRGGGHPRRHRAGTAGQGRQGPRGRVQPADRPRARPLRARPQARSHGGLASILAGRPAAGRHVLRRALHDAAKAGRAVRLRLHPHVLRSTGAIRWRQKGGSVASLLTMAGWTSSGHGRTVREGRGEPPGGRGSPPPRAQR